MKADALLSRLERVKQSGSGNWIARCPAHADKNPSMTIREADDGRVLIHCFTGCTPEEILSAVGLSFDALFPDKPIDHRVKPIRKPYPAADVLECLALEALIVQQCAGDIARGETLSGETVARVRLASERIEAGRSLANG